MKCGALDKILLLVLCLHTTRVPCVLLVTAASESTSTENPGSEDVSSASIFSTIMHNVRQVVKLYSEGDSEEDPAIANSTEPAVSILNSANNETVENLLPEESPQNSSDTNNSSESESSSDASNSTIPVSVAAESSKVGETKSQRNESDLSSVEEFSSVKESFSTENVTAEFHELGSETHFTTAISNSVQSAQSDSVDYDSRMIEEGGTIDNALDPDDGANSLQAVTLASAVPEVATPDPLPDDSDVDNRVSDDTELHSTTPSLPTQDVYATTTPQASVTTTPTLPTSPSIQESSTVPGLDKLGSSVESSSTGATTTVAPSSGSSGGMDQTPITPSPQPPNRRPTTPSFSNKEFSVETMSYPQPRTILDPERSTQCALQGERNLSNMERANLVTLHFKGPKASSVPESEVFCPLLTGIVSDAVKDSPLQGRSQPESVTVVFLDEDDDSTQNTLAFFVWNSEGEVVPGSLVQEYVERKRDPLQSETGREVTSVSVVEGRRGSGEERVASPLDNPVVATVVIASVVSVCLVAAGSLFVLVCWNRYKKRYHGEWIVNKRPQKGEKLDAWYYDNNAFLGSEEKELSGSYMSSSGRSPSSQSGGSGGDHGWLVPREMMEMVEKGNLKTPHL